MRLLWDNKFLNASVIASSENPNYLAVNMQDPVLAKVYRSVLDTTTIKISTQITASYFFLLGHNLTETATITLEGNDTDAWGAPSFQETVNWREDMCYLHFNEATYNYWRVIVSDTDTSADGYIEIGLMYFGTYLQMPGMKLDQGLEYKSDSSRSISYSGQVYGEERYEYRNPRFNFSYLSHDQRDELNEMFLNNKNVKPLICLVWANDFGIEAPMYCVIDQKNLPFKRNGENAGKDAWSTKIKFREVF